MRYVVGVVAFLYAAVEFGYSPAFLVSWAVIALLVTLAGKKQTG